MTTFKLTLEYDGMAYAGWQRQPDQPTIQAAVERALAQIIQRPVAAVAAGRTDAGVHALGQVVSFRSDKLLAPQEWARALNGLLPPDISVRDTEVMDEKFHARYSAREKVYEYRILNQRTRPALDRLRSWHIPKPLNILSIREAIHPLVGRHDFSSFQGSPTDNQNPTCHLLSLDVLQEGPSIRVIVRADRFLKHMVRSIVGTLVEIGHLKRDPSSMKQVLEARDRRVAGKTAPPRGLYLVKVLYEGDEPWYGDTLQFS